MSYENCTQNCTHFWQFSCYVERVIVEGGRKTCRANCGGCPIPYAQSELPALAFLKTKVCKTLDKNKPAPGGGGRKTKREVVFYGRKMACVTGRASWSCQVFVCIIYSFFEKWA